MSNIKLIHQEKVDYGRKLIVMGKGKNNNKGIKNNDDNNTTPPTKKFYEHPLFIAIFPAIVAAIISILFNVGSSTFLNQNDISHLNNKIDEIKELISSTKSDLQEDISQVSDDLKEYERDTNDKIEELNRVIGRLQGVTGIANNEIFVDENGQFALLVKNTYQSDKSVYLSSGAMLWNDNTEIIAQNAYSDIVYTVEELQNITILLHYTENGEDVFFKGQYDENGFWNGNCIINRYLNGKLTLIMDAEYNSGKLISYKQVFSYKKSYPESTYDVWAISEREPENGADRGFTWTYYKEGEYDQKFTSNLVMDTDILNAEEFMTKTSLLREGYYNGYISNGFYNDSTGNAYTIKYSPDGFIRLLYVGNFKDGKLTDYTGKAWYIILGYDNTNYYYYQGRFEEAVRLDDTDNPWLPLSPEEIESLTSKKEWDCDLNWM